MMCLHLAAIAALMSPTASHAAENWFLPYERDEHTLLLLHLDGEDAEEPNEGALDVTARLTGSATRTDGRFGRAVHFDGAKGSLSLSAHEGLQMSYNQPFTVELWFRPESGGQASLWSLGTRYYLKVAPTNGTFSFGYRAASFPIRWYNLAGPKISLRQWHHVALTHDATMAARIYLDGRLVGSAAHENEGDYEKGGGAQFGSHDGWTAFFTGDIDEVRLSNAVRDYLPVVKQPNVLPDEAIALNLELQGLPASVRGGRVTLRDGLGNDLASETVPASALASELFPGNLLPEAPPLLGDPPDPAAERPSRAVLQVDFLGEGDTVLASLTTPVRNIGAQVAEIKSVVGEFGEIAQGVPPDSPVAGRARQLRDLAERTDDLTEDRDIDAAYARLRAAGRIADAIRSGELDYRAALRKAVRGSQSANDTRITMSWHGDAPRAEEALPWAQRLGANELVTSSAADPATFAAWKQAGYRTVLLGNLPVHLNDHLKDHPEHAQYAWWVTLPVQAQGAEVQIPVESPTWGGTQISPHYEPKEHWWVVDQTTDEVIPADRWEVNESRNRVTVRGPTAGHEYVAYFMTWAPGVGDVLDPAFQEAGLRALDEKLAPYEGALDVYWFDDLAYAYPGPTPHGIWDWEAYVYMARPERLNEFERETGIKFDPRWLVHAPHTITADVPQQYLQWMYWVQPQVDAWMRKASDVVRRHNMQSWLYWGDTHVGTEPFLGSLDAGGIDQVDKPSNDPVTVRALTDYPGDQLRRFRIDWVYDHKAVTPQFAGQLRDQWARLRRGLLMKPISGIYWMPFQNAAANQEAAVREDLVDTMAEINDEFRLIADNLAGHAAWTHDIDVYVLNVWGKQYSWRPWGERRLYPFTDLPVRMHFLSLLEVQQSGIPEDADALVCYGMPNTAQNGGHWWSDRAIFEAVDRFVREGGGVIGMQAPSAHGEDGERWPLAEMLGIVPESSAAYSPPGFDASFLADVGGEGIELPPGTAVLVPTRDAEAHWLARRKVSVPAFSLDIKAAAVDPASTLYLARTQDGLFPGLVARNHGKGRCVWFAGFSAEPAFDRIVRDAVFWAAGREGESGRLEVAQGDEVYVYAYPSARMLAVHNASAEPIKAACRVDAAILGTEQPLSLRDLVTDEPIETANGLLSLDLPPQCTRLLRAE